ncbi:MAG: YihY/virulence factor BrkB family protein, partial [Actinobacteria bacterium]|nr:YihY/virulence factor BrkB family protein [Actinomycetota bacterium]
GSPALSIFAGVLLLWYVSGLVRACMGGLNSIYEADEKRPLLRRWGLSFALAVSVTGAVVLSVLAVTVGPRIDRGGISHVLLLVVRWPLAVIALGLAVGLLVRYGPAERRQVRWAPLGVVSLRAQIVGAGGGAATATGELRAGALPPIQMRSWTPRCNRSRRRFRESLRSAHLGCASTTWQLAFPISQLADSSLTPSVWRAPPDLGRVA